MVDRQVFMVGFLVGLQGGSVLRTFNIPFFDGESPAVYGTFGVGSICISHYARPGWVNDQRYP